MRAASALALVAAIALAASAATVLSHARDEVYAIPGWGVAVTVALLVAGLAGAGAVVAARRPALSAGVMAGTALAVFGLLAILSIGLIALIAGTALLAWALRGSSGPGRGVAIGGAALTGGVLPLLLVLATSGPVVECGVDETISGENLFMSIGGGASEGSVLETPDGSERGSARGASYRYTFACENGRLTEFDLRWR